MRIFPLTSFPGSEIQPSFSPDGNQIAFAWRSENSDHYNIYIKQVGDESVVQLTNGPNDDYSPSWAPDGRHIAFIRMTGKGFSHYLISPLGGVERRITENTFYQSRSRRITWSPDSQWLGFEGSSSEQEPSSIYLMRFETREMHKLTSPPAGIFGDEDPAFSPDGNTMAFIRFIGVNDVDLYQVPTAGGEPKRLTFDHSHISHPVWTPDGREILFLAMRVGCMGCLWRIPATGGRSKRIDLAGAYLESFAVSRQGTRLALSQNTGYGNIWQIELAGAQKLPPKKLISSTRFDSSPQYSPDGKKIVFVSNRSGSFEIWVCDSDGQHPVQLTSQTRSGSPRWSPDGRQIIYDSVAEGSADIYVINAEGGQARRLTTDPSEDIVPSWSHDGQWIYFCSSRSGSLQIWKMPAAGGPAIQITKQGGFDNVESPDGRFLYYAKGRGVPGIWRVPVKGGAEVPVLDHRQAGYLRHWAVVERGIYFATAEDPVHPLIEFFNFATGQITPVARIEKQIPTGLSGLAVSPEERKLIYSQNDQIGGDIMLLENFR
jgi:Tol biopolymer transport system component